MPLDDESPVLEFAPILLKVSLLLLDLFKARLLRLELKGH